MNTISPLQLGVLALCARCFSMMTYFPYTGRNTLVFMAALVISCALQGLMLIPAVVLCKREGCGLCEAAARRSVTLAKAAALLFLAYFLWDIFATVGTFAYFTDQYFSDQISRIPAVICAGTAALYLATMRSGVLGKCAGIVFVLFIAFFVILFLSAADAPDMSNFHLAQRDLPKTLMNDVGGEFVRNRELVMLVFLLGDVKGSCTKAAYSYLVMKLVILETVMGFAALVLGELAQQTDMPVFYLSCYSNSSLIERYDAGFMSVWTMLAVLRLAALVHCAGRCVKVMFPKLTGNSSTIAAGVLPAVAAAALLLKRRWKTVAYLREPAVLIAVTAAVIPCVVYLLVKGRKKAA